MSEIYTIVKIDNSRDYLVNQIKTKTNVDFDIEFKENPLSVSIILKKGDKKIRLKTIMINSLIWRGDVNDLDSKTFSKKLLNKLAEKSKMFLK